MFHGVYKGLKVLVTGHTGFKGSWLTAWLLSLGAEVAGLADGLPTEPANFGILGLAGRMRDVRADVRDRVAVRRLVREFAPDVVFHLAAQALVRKGYEAPAPTFETNALGTLNVLEALRETPSVRACVCITSDKAYRNDEWVWGYREQDALGGHDPYSASKGCAEIIAHAYFTSFFHEDGPACATTRAGNVIGGGDWAADRLVPDCVRAWSEGRAVRIRNPWATRPWQHVLEPLSGYLWLGALLLAGAETPFSLRGQAYNFGPAADANNSVAEVVDALALHWPGFSHARDRRRQQADMRECTLLKLCCDKALAHLRWKATLDFEETIRYTAEWYRACYAGDNRLNMLEFTLGQIAAYTNAAAQRGLAWAQAGGTEESA